MTLIEHMQQADGSRPSVIPCGAGCVVARPIEGRYRWAAYYLPTDMDVPAGEPIVGTFVEVYQAVAGLQDMAGLIKGQVS